MEKKIAKREYFEAIKEVMDFAIANGYEGAITPEEISAFVDVELTNLNAKYEKAKAARAAKRAVDDTLIDVIKGVLTTEVMTGNDVVAALANEDITKGKVVTRLTKLVEAGEVIKENITTGEGKNKRKVVGYRLA